MKRYAPLQAARSNAAEPTSQRKLKPLSTQNADPLQRLADQSGQVGQLQRLQAGADSHVQRTGIPAQRAATEDEDMLQGKFKTAQLAAPEEEEPLQGRFDAAQAAGLEEEEPLQGKFKTAQLATPEEEEEPLQGRFETAQAAGLEEEEPLQGKFERVTGSSEAVHRKVDPTTEVNGVPVNDDPALEHEADVMGAKAAQFVPEEEEPLQGKFGAVAQKAEAQPNQTGLPDNLKAGVENLSGMSMDGVRVHYNSSKPAQLNALAYAQGTDIHVGPGQEKHLPHEAWHVVQQGHLSEGATMLMMKKVLVNSQSTNLNKSSYANPVQCYLTRPESAAGDILHKDRKDILEDSTLTKYAAVSRKWYSSWDEKVKALTAAISNDRDLDYKRMSSDKLESYDDAKALVGDGREHMYVHVGDGIYRADRTREKLPHPALFGYDPNVDGAGTLWASFAQRSNTLRVKVTNSSGHFRPPKVDEDTRNKVEEKVWKNKPKDVQVFVDSENH